MIHNDPEFVVSEELGDLSSQDISAKYDTCDEGVEG